MVRRLEEMYTCGLHPDVVTYGLLLDYLCKNGKCSEARKIFDSMIRKGIKPNVTIYDILLHGYAAKGALADLPDLLDLMVANGISPDHYMHMLKGQ